ncbi:hypothetical protein OHS18_17460 [Amycolatopsis sp. NBC_00355]|uniref:hypothetical protein n=1 Tax=Amycolatopsis sp. NBC_00355 TaxID=2975957 RepID=UPI002E254786
MQDFHHRAFSTQQGKLITTPDMPARAETHRKLLLEARAAQQAGLAADSPQARELAERAADRIAAMTGKQSRAVAGQVGRHEATDPDKAAALPRVDRRSAR